MSSSDSVDSGTSSELVKVPVTSHHHGRELKAMKKLRKSGAPRYCYKHLAKKVGSFQVVGMSMSACAFRNEAGLRKELTWGEIPMKDGKTVNVKQLKQKLERPSFKGE